MEQQSKIQIDFGIPEHGWLLTTFKSGEYKLQIEISDVPINPMTQLCSTLIQLTKGINTPDVIPWHLEPYCYYVQFSKTVDNYRTSILESDNLDSPTKLVKEIDGNFEKVIMPFYRALKKFNSKSYEAPHWDKLEIARIEELTELVKGKKEHNTR